MSQREATNNDPVHVRLLMALCDLSQTQVQECIEFLLDLGRRYILLAMALTHDLDPDEIEHCLPLEGDRVLGTFCSQGSSAHHQRQHAAQAPDVNPAALTYS